MIHFRVLCPYESGAIISGVQAGVVEEVVRVKKHENTASIFLACRKPAETSKRKWIEIYLDSEISLLFLLCLAAEVFSRRGKRGGERPKCLLGQRPDRLLYVGGEGKEKTFATLGC